MSIKKNQTGVSLIELIVSLGLFSVILLSATEIFKTVVDGQRSAISAQNVQENIRYAMEKMSKEIRMAVISDHGCESILSPQPTAINKVFNKDTDANGNDRLYFKNKDNNCVAYYLVNNRLKIKVLTGVSAGAYDITPGKIQVSNLKFFMVDDLIGAFHSKQPYVAMVMDAKAAGLAIHQQKMKIQMTVSSRYYE